MAKYVAVSLFVIVTVGLFTDSIFQCLNIDFPAISTFLNSLAGVVITFSLLKFGAYSLNVEVAADNLFSAMPDSLVLVDITGEILRVNRSLLQLAGCIEKEVVGKTIFEMSLIGNVISNTGEVIPKIFDDLKQKKELRDIEFKFKTKNNEEKIGILSCTIVTNKMNQDIGAVAIIRDITARIDMEQKLLKLKGLHPSAN